MSDKFNTIVVDPPWPMPETGARSDNGKRGEYIAKGGRRVKAEWWGNKTGKSVKLPYSTMSLQQIADLKIPASKNAHLYLWTVNRYVETAYQITRGWGFAACTLLVWAKPPMGIGFGGTFCNTTEYILFCRRGILKSLAREDSTWWKWSRPYENGHIAHSVKPDAFIDMVMRVSPPTYLEMFSRSQRLGWSTWGNECFNHVEISA